MFKALSRYLMPDIRLSEIEYRILMFKMSGSREYHSHVILITKFNRIFVTD